MEKFKFLISLRYKTLFWFWLIVPVFTTLTFINKIPFNKQLSGMGRGKSFGDIGYNPANHVTSYFEAFLWIAFFGFLFWIPLKIISEILNFSLKIIKKDN